MERLCFTQRILLPSTVEFGESEHWKTENIHSRFPFLTSWTSTFSLLKVLIAIGRIKPGGSEIYLCSKREVYAANKRLWWVSRLHMVWQIILMCNNLLPARGNASENATEKLNSGPNSNYCSSKLSSLLKVGKWSWRPRPSADRHNKIYRLAVHVLKRTL